MTKTGTYILLFILLISGLKSEGQDIHFSQFEATPTLINPATTGFFRGSQRAILVHRSQWVALGSPYQTFGLTYDMKLLNKDPKKAYLGLGVHAFKDQAGDSKFGTLNVDLSVSAILPLGKSSKIGVGIQGGYAQQSAEVGNLVFQNQWDGDAFDPDKASGEGNLLNSFGYPDFATGIFYEVDGNENSITEKYFSHLRIGASYYHITQPEILFYSQDSETLYTKMIFHASLRKDIKGTKVGLVPMGFHSIQGPHTQTNVGLLLRVNLRDESRYTDIIYSSSVSFGLQHRLNDSWIPQFHLELGDIRLGLSYDFGVSDLNEAANSLGSFEVSFGWKNSRRDVHASRHRGRKTRL